MKKLALIGLLLLVGTTLSAQEPTLAQLHQKILELEKRIKLLEKTLLARSNTPGKPQVPGARRQSSLVSPEERDDTCTGPKTARGAESCLRIW